jgi:RND family efflux transporter MFP subunit
MNRSDLLEQLRIARDAPRPRVRWGWLLVGAAVLAAAGWYVLLREPRVVVRTALAQPAASAVPDTPILDASGYVTARRQATVSAKITGRVAEVLIEEGQHVAADEVLARLDPTDADAQLALSTAQLRAAEAQLADLEVQRAQAERDARRQQDLVARHLTSTQAYESARTLVESLGARLATQRQLVGVAQRAVQVAEVGRDNTIVRAPFAGVITVKAAQPGEIVSPISAGGGFTRTGIGTIVDMDSLEIEVDVNEAYISRVQPGQSVQAVLNAYPDWQIPAHVITIIPAADRSKATVKVRIALDLKDPRIVPDMGVRVSFLEEPGAPAALPPPSSVLVPSSVVIEQGDATNVFVLHGDRVELRSVTLGQRSGESREVVQGLAAGDRVVVAPPPTLADGQRVEQTAEE